MLLHLVSTWHGIPCRPLTKVGHFEARAIFHVINKHRGYSNY